VTAREILPPPRAVVTAAYLATGPDGPKVIMEICPACTAQKTLAERDCLCRVQCTWPGCPWDDPANLNAIARKADAERAGKSTPECRGFRWLGQPFTSCDHCGRPAWEHDGIMRLREGVPSYGGTEDWELRPWAPGEADEIRRKWESAGLGGSAGDGGGDG
jgi:hypothetical protein